MFKCKYCGKEFETKQQLGGHVTRCKLNPNYQNNLQQLENARKHINKEHEHQHLFCQYCGKEIGNKGCLVLHENRCLSNPNYIPTEKQLQKQQYKNQKQYNKDNGIIQKRKPLSEAHKQKIREGLQHWKETHKEEFLAYSRSQSKCCENFKKYLRQNNIDFIEEYIPYPNERLYRLDISFPDEKIGIEINGSQHYDNEGNLNQATLDKQKFFEDKGWKIIQIYYKWCYGILNKNKEINSIFDLQIHNKDYVKEIYTRKYQKEQLKNHIQIIKDKQKQEKIDNQKQIIYNLINNSGINFSKSGWSTKAIKYLKSRNEPWNKGIFRCIRKYYPEFLQREDVYKRKSSKI